ncbi:AraC family transcriptional regulator [Catenuloplanes japonicus]|uniref:AraC family transcriptional regulator n=1 Tax=Catenuloplanes japonicus TaxID=33876 RepID=UPI00052695AE|nr:AraC family transcriptional regulator [Catenuloplanes japonicus]
MTEEIARLIARHARPDLGSAIDGLLLSRVTGSETHYSLTSPLLVVMAQGGKRLWLGEREFGYRAGQCLIVTATLPVTGHFDASPDVPSLACGLVLDPAAIAPLLDLAPVPDDDGDPAAMATQDAPPELLDAVLRLLRLLERPADAPVLAPMIVREILWRLLTGPHGGLLRRAALDGGGLERIGRAIGWIRANYAEPLRIDDAARVAGMSRSAFDRQFRAVTAMSPLQFQKRLRLQQARTLLLAGPPDVAGVGHRVGYDSPSQFTREYRRLFGAPPTHDTARRRSPSITL